MKQTTWDFGKKFHDFELQDEGQNQNIKSETSGKMAVSPQKNAKNQLQELNPGQLPLYATKSTGPSHDPLWTATCIFHLPRGGDNDPSRPALVEERGEGKTKVLAETAAAQAVLDVLNKTERKKNATRQLIVVVDGTTVDVSEQDRIKHEANMRRLAPNLQFSCIQVVTSKTGEERGIHYHRHFAHRNTAADICLFVCQNEDVCKVVQTHCLSKTTMECVTSLDDALISLVSRNC